MSNPLIRIHNMATNEVIDREMNAKELATYKATQDADKAQAKVAADKAVAKQTVLDKLGLTADEAALLLG